MSYALRLFRLLALVLFAAPAAHALPAPMSKSELLANSDLVALVRILSVTCTKVTKDQHTGEGLPSYVAKAELIEVIKGEEIKGDDVLITFHAIPSGVLGPWTVYYYPGEMVWTHLVKTNGGYTTTWWNGRGTVVEEPLTKALPVKPGETVDVTRTRVEHPVVR